MVDLISGWQGIAGTAIIISIIISGIALGMGRAFSIKRLERFGADEILQSIINAAILGFAVGLSVLVLQVAAEFTPQSNVPCPAGANPADLVLCSINATQNASFSLMGDMVRVQNTLAYYQTLSLNFGNFTIQPLANLQSISTQLSNSLYAMQSAAFASAINAQFLSFISSGWFGAIFAAGLVFRSFFLSRRFGAFLIAASLSFIVFYPLMIMMFQLPLGALSEAKSLTGAFLSNSAYQTIPIVDLNGNNAIAGKIYNMSFAGAPNATASGPDFTGDLTLLVQKTTNAAALLFFQSFAAPLLALIATGVLVKELSHSLAGEIATEITQL